ncbi:MAG TPA: hypothetical protein VF326_12820 [Anaerolineaceae bacterium]
MVRERPRSAGKQLYRVSGRAPDPGQHQEGLEDPQKGCLPGSFAFNDILAHLGDPGINPVSYRDGYDPIKNRKTRFAIVTREILISGEPHA